MTLPALGFDEILEFGMLICIGGSHIDDVGFSRSAASFLLCKLA